MTLIYFWLMKQRRKITKLAEFWRLYVEWCREFDKKADSNFIDYINSR